MRLICSLRHAQRFLRCVHNWHMLPAEGWHLSLTSTLRLMSRPSSTSASASSSSSVSASASTSSTASASVSASASKSLSPLLFDPHTKALQKARAAISDSGPKYDYLRDHMANVIIDRLGDISRTFPETLDLFCGSSHFFRALVKANNPCKIQQLHHMDVHKTILSKAAQHFDDNIAREIDSNVFNERCDTLPFKPGSLDLVTSIGGLHWMNDLPNVLTQIRQCLKPDGVFVGAMFGGDTLHELRVSMQLAEEEICKRIAPRVSPMVRLRDVANLVSAGGFTLPTVDVERVVVTYENMSSLMQHLKGMGESNALVKREIHFGRRSFERAGQIYDEHFGSVDSTGARRVGATFEIMYMIGWAPSASQPKPLRRGSAGASLTELANTDERR